MTDFYLLGGERQYTCARALILPLISCLLAPQWRMAENQKLVVVTKKWPPFRINIPDRPNDFRGIDIDLSIATDPNLSYDVARIEYRNRLGTAHYQPAQKNRTVHRPFPQVSAT